MRKITGQLLSSKPVSISRAAKLVTRFAAVDNGSSATVSLYLQRTTDAFNQLVQFHSNHPKNSAVEISLNRERPRKETENHEKIPDAKMVEDLENRGGKDKKTVNEAVEANLNEDDVRDLKREEKEQKKKKKKMKSDDDSKKKKRRKGHGDEKKSKKKRID